MPLLPWRRLGAERVYRARIFDLDRVSFEPPDGRPARDFFVVDAPDWINVIPLTGDGRIVFLRQYRHGIEGFTLEIPGGMCDRGEDPASAAARELREEAGYAADDLVALGWVHPNPAIQANRCHTFLARGARRVGEPTPDPDESFELALHPREDVPGLIASGRITHALVVAAFQLWAARPGLA